MRKYDLERKTVHDFNTGQKFSSDDFLGSRSSSFLEQVGRGYVDQEKENMVQSLVAKFAHDLPEGDTHYIINLCRNLND